MFGEAEKKIHKHLLNVKGKNKCLIDYSSNNNKQVIFLIDCSSP